MSVLLIQPPDIPERFNGVDTSFVGLFAPAPPWNLMCLQRYLEAHTRHLCHFADCRLMADPEAELAAIIAARSPIQMVVVNARTENLGPVSSVLDICKRHAEGAYTALCGQHPSQFPGHVLNIPRVDFGLAGDPEPILRNLLDNLDVPARLRHVSGLIHDPEMATPPHWMPQIDRLTLPDFSQVFWRSYRLPEVDSPPARAVVRLSRGHTRQPADRAMPGVYEPFRLWPLAKFAQFMQTCTRLEIGEVFFDDPPGVWTPDRLRNWCLELEHVRNVRSWALRMLPASLDEEDAQQLAASHCRRIEFLIPSCDPEILERYGCIIGFKDLEHTALLLERFGITPNLRFWVGGPEEKPGEGARLQAAYRKVGCRYFAAEPFPCLPDQPLHQELGIEEPRASLEAWMRWARAPWTTERPAAIWGGPDQLPEIARCIRQLERISRRNLALRMKRGLRSFREARWVQSVESLGLYIFPHANRR